MKLNFFCLILIATLAVSNVIKSTSAQTISPITYTTSCCSVTLRSEIDPFIASYIFTWNVENNEQDYKLADVGMDGSGNVAMIYDTGNPYTGDIEISNSPSTLSPNNAPFNTTLIFPHNQTECGWVFTVRASPLEQEITVPCSADCDALNGVLCPTGCFCDQAPTTQAEETTEIPETTALEETAQSSIINISISQPEETTDSISQPSQSEEATIISARTQDTNEEFTSTKTTNPETRDYGYIIIAIILVPVGSVTLIASIVYYFKIVRRL